MWAKEQPVERGSFNRLSPGRCASPPSNSARTARDFLAGTRCQVVDISSSSQRIWQRLPTARSWTQTRVDLVDSTGSGKCNRGYEQANDSVLTASSSRL